MAIITTLLHQKQYIMKSKIHEHKKTTKYYVSNNFILILVSLISFTAFSQTKISGKVVNKKNVPMQGVNVFIDGTYDGALTNENGEFSFETDAIQNQVLKFTLNGFLDITESIVIEEYTNRVFTLFQDMNTIETVVISAGTIKAGDNSKVTALKPLDIVTTAGSSGDIVAALETMPGVNAVGESGRLFVRGGESGETQTYVDGIRVAQPYGASPNNIPTRGRFSPFLFKGITFSTGGYSAEFGDALSSVLLLNTVDEPAQNQTDISIMTVGVGLGKSKKWKNSSITFNTSYINLKPYYLLAPQSLDWNKAPETLAGETVFRTKIRKGLLKVYAAFDHSTMNVNQKDINYSDKIKYGLTNNNFYINSVYKNDIATALQLQTGFSFGYGNNQIGINSDKLNNYERALHYKLKLRKTFSNMFKLNVGGEFFHTSFDENYKNSSQSRVDYGYQNNTIALYTEAEVFLSQDLAFNVGLRSSNASVVDEITVEPRVSVAYKIAQKSQLSLAYGSFYQTANPDYLKFTQNLKYENTNHYILNYLYNNNGKMFRAEAYFKDYSNLVKFDSNVSSYASNFNNNGLGYAKGIDLFWRDNKTVKNLDYWLTYSFIDSERDYKNYEKQVTPSFVANHNFSIVTKFWVDELKSQIGLTYSFNSGRPYDNPNETEFMNQKTKSYNNFSLGWSYLLSQQKILYFSVSNLLGANNVFGYQYANSPDVNGTFQRQAVTQPASRFFFVGFFWTISDNKKTNQLDQL